MADETILHQDDVEAVIEDVIAEHSDDNVAIDDVDPAGVAYAQAEVNAAIDAINDILAALRNSGIIPESE